MSAITRPLALVATLLGVASISAAQAQISTVIVDSRSISIDSFSRLIRDNAPMKAFRIHGGGWASLPDEMSDQDLGYLTVIDVPHVFSSICRNDKMTNFNMTNGSFSDADDYGVCSSVNHVSFENVKWQSSHSVDHLFPNAEVIEVYASDCSEVASFAESSGLRRFDQASIGNVVLLVNADCVSDFLDSGFRRVEGH